MLGLHRSSRRSSKGHACGVSDSGGAGVPTNIRGVGTEVPAAIHMDPEAIARNRWRALRRRPDCQVWSNGELQVLVDDMNSAGAAERSSAGRQQISGCRPPERCELALVPA